MKPFHIVTAIGLLVANISGYLVGRDSVPPLEIILEPGVPWEMFAGFQALSKFKVSQRDDAPKPTYSRPATLWIGIADQMLSSKREKGWTPFPSDDESNRYLRAIDP